MREKRSPNMAPSTNMVYDDLGKLLSAEVIGVLRRTLRQKSKHRYKRQWDG